MDVIRHQDVAMNLEPIRSGRIREQLEVVDEVACGVEDRRAIISTLDDVNRVAGNEESWKSSHATEACMFRANREARTSVESSLPPSGVRVASEAQIESDPNWQISDRV